MMEMLEKIKKSQNVKKYEDAILKVEKLSGLSKLPTSRLFYSIYEKTDDETYLKIANDISGGKKKSEIYRDYVSDEIYLIMRESEKRNLPLYQIVDKLDKVRDVLKKVSSKIYSSLKFGIGYYVFISFVTYFILLGVKGNFGSIDLVKDKQLMNNIIIIYPYVNFIIFIAMVFSFYKFKFKVPIIKDIFINIELTQILVLTKLLYSANLPIKSVIEYFADSKSYFSGKFKEIIERNRQESLVSEYVEAIKDNLTPEEASILEIAFKTGRFREILSVIADERTEIIKNKVEGYSKTIIYFCIALSIIPLGMMLITYMNVVLQLLRGALKLMNSY